MNDYDCMCIFYLGVQTIKILQLEDKCLYIDNYYDLMKNLYKDYINYDNSNKSLLDSINDYIINNTGKIQDKIKDCINN